jgi:hypothetical protein
MRSSASSELELEGSCFLEGFFLVRLGTTGFLECFGISKVSGEQLC